MDADFSHNPAQLPALIAGVAHADLVLGSRYIPGGGVVNWPLRRVLLSRFANGYIRTVTRLNVRDCTTGYRCWRLAALGRLPLDRIRSEGYSFLIETLFMAARSGARVAEVPITFVERRQGESKLSRGVIFESVLTPWRLAACRRTR
jgi:dolichol-phosphate mannosyltransferase